MSLVAWELASVSTAHGERTTDKKVFSTIARDLAAYDPFVRRTLRRAFHDDNTLKRTTDIARQCQEFVVGPVGMVPKAIASPFLIIIDGLNESGEANSWEQMLRLLSSKLDGTANSQLYELQDNYRILVTSRPLKDIHDALYAVAHVQHISMDDIRVPPSSTERDIQLYVSVNLAGPFDGGHFKTLAQKSDGVFEWARLACEYIKDTVGVGLDPMIGFERVLAGTPENQTYPLDVMYRHFLAEIMPEDERGEVIPMFRSVMGQILALQEPLPMSALTAIRLHFPCDDDRYDVVRVIGPLDSLVIGVADCQISIRLRPSFYDFLTDHSRSHDFFADVSSIQTDLAFASLWVVECGLHFNSYLPNSAVPDLHKRVEGSIPAESSYSCRFWGTRVQAVSFEPALAKEVEAFFFSGERLLFWLEAPALIKGDDSSAGSLSSISDWLKRLAVALCQVITKARAMLAGSKPMELANEAARIVTQSVNLAPDVKAIPPILLSCAIELFACARKIGDPPKTEIVCVPDWGAIGYDDRRIMQHPSYTKAVVWMSSANKVNDKLAMKASGNGINWKEIVHGGVDQREVLGRHEDGAEANTSHQPLMEEAVRSPDTLQMPKSRTFGPAKRKAADRKGKGVEREREDVEPRKGEDRGMATKNIQQQHLSDERDSKRRRTSHMLAEDGLMEEASKMPKHDKTQVTEDHCTPCDERSLECVFGYSQKTGNRFNSCEECTKKKRKCFDGRKPETVVKDQDRQRPRTNSRVRSKTGSPTASGTTSRAAFPSPSQSRRSITMTSPRVQVVSPDITLSSMPPIPAPVGADINSMEGRLVMLEAGLAKLNTTIEKLGGEHEALRQVMLSQHPTILLSHGPSTLPSPALQADAAQPSRENHDVFDFGVGPLVPETPRYKTKNTNAMTSVN
ncbi:hypothetical protein F4604DRAFT_1936749 [Suillus subluteus]|nr:hypothetical protein F4604DRAFT_1936749 [Suillus subluteus]